MLSQGRACSARWTLLLTIAVVFAPPRLAADDHVAESADEHKTLEKYPFAGSGDLCGKGAGRKCLPGYYCELTLQGLTWRYADIPKAALFSTSAGDAPPGYFEVKTRGPVCMPASNLKRHETIRLMLGVLPASVFESRLRELRGIPAAPNPRPTAEQKRKAKRSTLNAYFADFRNGPTFCTCSVDYTQPGHRTLSSPQVCNRDGLGKPIDPDGIDGAIARSLKSQVAKLPAIGGVSAQPISAAWAQPRCTAGIWGATPFLDFNRSITVPRASDGVRQEFTASGARIVRDKEGRVIEFEPAVGAPRLHSRSKDGGMAMYAPSFKYDYYGNGALRAYYDPTTRTTYRPDAKTGAWVPKTKDDPDYFPEDSGGISLYDWDKRKYETLVPTGAAKAVPGAAWVGADGSLQHDPGYAHLTDQDGIPSHSRGLVAARGGLTPSWYRLASDRALLKKLLDPKSDYNIYKMSGWQLAQFFDRSGHGISAADTRKGLNRAIAGELHQNGKKGTDDEVQVEILRLLGTHYGTLQPPFPPSEVELARARLLAAWKADLATLDKEAKRHDDYVATHLPAIRRLIKAAPFSPAPKRDKVFLKPDVDAQMIDTLKGLDANGLLTDRRLREILTVPADGRAALKRLWQAKADIQLARLNTDARQGTVSALTPQRAHAIRRALDQKIKDLKIKVIALGIKGTVYGLVEFAGGVAGSAKAAEFVSETRWGGWNVNEHLVEVTQPGAVADTPDDWVVLADAGKYLDKLDAVADQLDALRKMRDRYRRIEKQEE
jgi:hypothetical protein